MQGDPSKTAFISLDLFSGIGTFQRLTAEKIKKIQRRINSPTRLRNTDMPDIDPINSLRPSARIRPVNGTLLPIQFLLPLTLTQTSTLFSSEKE
jgi:hypothetical protein